MVTLVLLQIALVFPPGRSLAPLALESAVAEADSLWSRYGISIVAADDCSAPRSLPVIRVIFVDSMHARVAVLGAITFDDDGVPSPEISIFLGDIQRLIAGTRLFGEAAPQWPPAVRDRVVGRVVGRVLAHEVGHYLLRMPGHARAGLMRPQHLTPMLVAPERRPFALTRPEAARLAQQARKEEAR